MYDPDEDEAIRHFNLGHKVQFSTNIAGNMTYGYGKLDANGFWQYPLPFEYLNENQKRLVRIFDTQDIELA
jgi:hypothetical protein